MAEPEFQSGLSDLSHPALNLSATLIRHNESPATTEGEGFLVSWSSFGVFVEYMFHQVTGLIVTITGNAVHVPGTRWKLKPGWERLDEEQEGGHSGDTTLWGFLAALEGESLCMGTTDRYALSLFLMAAWWGAIAGLSSLRNL